MKGHSRGSLLVVAIPIYPYFLPVASTVFYFSLWLWRGFFCRLVFLYQINSFEADAIKLVIINVERIFQKKC